MPRQKNIFDSNFDRVNTGLTLGAQTSAKCADHSRAMQQNGFTTFDEKLKKEMGIVEWAVYKLQKNAGLRISEVLAIKNTDVAENGLIAIKTKKTGEVRIIDAGEQRAIWAKQLKYMLPLNTVYSRFYFYRLYKKLGIYAKYGNNKKNSVTHSLRHDLVLSLRKQGFTEKSISEYLAHRSQKSLKYYEQPKK